MRRSDSVPNREHSLKCQLAAQVLRSFGRLRLGVTGSSMLPAIWPGDVLLIERRDAGEVLPGDIILFTRGEKLIVHRLLRKAGGTEHCQLFTQGDGMLMPDSPISAKEILGKVQYIFRDGKRLNTRTGTSLRGRCIAKVVRRSSVVARTLVRLRSFYRHLRRREVLCQS